MGKQKTLHHKPSSNKCCQFLAVSGSHQKHWKTGRNSSPSRESFGTSKPNMGAYMGLSDRVPGYPWIWCQISSLSQWNCQRWGGHGGSYRHTTFSDTKNEQQPPGRLPRWAELGRASGFFCSPPEDTFLNRDRGGQVMDLMKVDEVVTPIAYSNQI